MRYFLIKLLRLATISFFIFFTFLIVILSHLKYRIDPFYNKLTSATEKGLILGDSRALQGLDPKYLRFPSENFAFTIGHSPYDKSYIKLIKKKLNNIEIKNRTHIVCVSPWSLLTNNKDHLDLNPYFTETLSLPLFNPNFEYLFKYVDFNFTQLNKLISSKQISKKNGYLMVEMDSGELQREYPRRVKEKIENYTAKYPFEILTLESSRVLNVTKIINFLQMTGDVHIVRLPVSPEMLKLEILRFPNFNHLMNQLSKNESVNYINLSDMKIRTIDGNHIYYKDVPRVSCQLDTLIKKLRPNRQ
jgi:hypothetical protein